MIMDVSEVLKALADPNRIRILNLLHERTLCVCDLEAILELNQSNLSRHLSKLKHAGLVKSQKKALFTYYSREAIHNQYGPIVEALCEAIHTDPAWQSDRARLAKRVRSSQSRC
jgi:ArsR family transcriptional regulator